MIKYCTKELREVDGKYYYKNCFSSEKTVRMCSKEKVHKVNVREASPEEETPYVGWLKLKPEGDIDFIFPNLTLLEVCFPYGTKAEAERGRGKVIRVKIEEL